MSARPHILILTDWFTPGYKAGGPIRSIENLVREMSSDFQFSVVTSDRDLLDTQPYTGINTNEWIDLEGYRVIYLSPEHRSNRLREILVGERYHRVYLNSFFSASFAVRPMLTLWLKEELHKVILAPRGMLGEGALQIKSLKKKVFITAVRAFGWHRKIVFHSTDQTETRSIRAQFGKAVVREATNIPVQVGSEVHPNLHSTVKFVFASRISPKKNLLWLVKLMTSLKGRFQLDIFGAADDERYRQQCASAIGSDTRFQWHEPVAPSELKFRFLESDFFVLPTRNENFGHAIIEALAAGTPVIISDQTPWNDVQKAGAGWVVSLDEPDRWKEVLQQACSLSQENYEAMSAAALDYVRHKFNIDEIRHQYKALFA